MTTVATVEDKPRKDSIKDTATYSTLGRLMILTVWVMVFVHNVKTMSNWLSVSQLKTAGQSELELHR